MTVAKQDSWKTCPMPEGHAELAYRAEFGAEELRTLERGLIPDRMEDKWFIYWEDDQLHLHRSWTGHLIFLLELEREGEGARVRRTVVNRDSQEYASQDDRYDAALLDFLIRALLLNQDVPFPVQPDYEPSSPPGLFQHGMIGQGRRERRIDEK